MVEEEKKSEFTYILAGDIGATNARFVLKKIENVFEIHYMFKFDF